MVEPTIRKYEERDFDQLLNLLHDDDFGKKRESLNEKDLSAYRKAINEIVEDKNFDIHVMCNESDELIGCFQIMFLPHISFQGTKRCQVESVRIRSDLRGQGLGKELMKYSIEVAKGQGCGIFQLTSNKERKEANKFYRGLGLEPTHDGYKLYF